MKYFSQYGVCPSCLNPIQLIGITEKIKDCNKAEQRMLCFLFWKGFDFMVEFISRLCVFSPLIIFLIFLFFHCTTNSYYKKIEMFLIILQVVSSIICIIVFKFYFMDLSISIFE